MKDKEIFPDYQPKVTPDTIQDYIRNLDSKIFKIISEIGEPSLEKLKEILRSLKIYKIEAEKNPGDSQPGNITLGADLNQYFPSEEEIIVSELGLMIKSIIEITSKQKIEEFKKTEGISSQKIVFNEIIYRHVDVMGSGRFFYAEKDNKEIELSL